VQHDDGGLSAGDQAPHQREHLEGMPDIEMARRFVEQ